MPLEKWSYTPPPLSANNVLIAISHCGICGSDIHTIDSGWGPANYPVIVGHEIIGTVAALGSNVTNLQIGDRVGVGAQCNSCHQCATCNSGNENVCPKSTFTYNSKHPEGHPSYGGYADQVIVPAPFVFQIPTEISSAEAAPLLCAGVTVYSPLKKYMGPSSRVGVVGIGGLGHLALQFAKALGASQVVAITSSAKKVVDLTKLGATKVLVSSDADAMAKGKRTLDLIICTANQFDINWEGYLSLLDVNGKMVILGVPEQKVHLSLSSLIYAQVSLVGSLIGAPHVIQEMLEFAAKSGVRPWIQVAPMAQVNESIAKVRANNVKYRFVLEN